MKKKFTLALSFLLCAGMVYDYNTRSAHSSSTGAPSGNTGDPAVSSGQTCGMGGCHTSGAVTPSGNEVSEIASNIPQGGYVPGETYDMTVSVGGAGGSKFGFSLSVGGNEGTLIAGANTQLNGSGNYVTHTFNSNTGSGSNTWNFQWTAPQSGAGAVTFYASTLYANGSGSSGDVTVPVSTTVQEASGVGITEAELEALTVYPNPVIDEINVAAKDVDEEIMFTMYGIDGRQILEETHNPGEITINVGDKTLSTGVYFLRMESGENTVIKKLLVK